MQSVGTEVRIGFKAKALLALVALIGLGACSSMKTVHGQVDESGLDIDLELKTTTLDNGLTVVLVEDPSVPIVSYQTWYRVGSVDEKPGITGISHLFEHLMFKGTPKYGPKAFFQQLESKGAEVNAFTTRDYTVYYENFAPTLLDKVVEMESDRMENLILSDQVVNAEKLVVLEERRLRNENTPEGKMQEALWQLAYRSHPYRWPVIGYPQDVVSVGLPEIQDYYKTHYQPRNAAVVVVGAFDADHALDLIRKNYGSLQAVDRPKRDIAPEPEQTEERRLVLHDQVASERFAQAYHVPGATQDDAYALDVLAGILFEGTSSRAYRRLVEEKQVALGISGSAYTPTYPGLFVVSGTMKPGVHASVAEAMIADLFREVQETPVTAEEIRVAVKQLTVQLVDGVRTPYGLGMLIGTVQTILGDPSLFASDLAKYMKVTPADIQRVARKYLIPNNRTVVTLSPKKLAQAPKKTEVQ